VARVFGLTRIHLRRKETTTMTDRYFANIESIESSGVVLTIEALPRLLIFGDTAEQALRRACEAIGFYLRETSRVERPVVELVRSESIWRLASVLAEHRQAAA
jgi:predicted RNase H-like HicB family nuclease